MTVIRHVLWLAALALMVLTGWTVAQSSVVLLLKGEFIWDGAPAFFLGLPVGELWVVILLFFAVFVVARTVWPPPGRKVRDHAFLRVGLWVVTVVLAALSVIGFVRGGSGLATLLRGEADVPLDPIPVLWFDVPNVWWLWGAFVSAIYLFIVYLSLAYRAHIRHAGRRPGNLPDRVTLDTDQILAESRDFEITEWQRELFIDLLSDSPKYVEQISETVEPSSRSTKITTEYTINLGHDVPGGSIVLPVSVAPRGQTEEGLTVTDGTGHRLTVFPYRSAIAYTAAVIRSGIAEAGEDAVRRYETDDHLEREIVGFLARQSYDDDESPIDQRLVAERFAQLARRVLNLPTDDESHLYRPVLALGALYRSYPIVVSVTSAPVVSSVRGSIVDLTMQRRTTPALSTAPGWFALFARAFSDLGPKPLAVLPRRLWFGFKNKLTHQLRLLLGVRSNRLAHPIGNASRARNYHLAITGPPDTYMARQSLESLRGWDGDYDLMDRVQALANPAVGQRHSHLYVTNGPKFLSRFLFSTAYFERTPGSMAIAFVAASTSLLLAVLIAFDSVAGGEFGRAADPDDTSGAVGLFQILFAFPIVAAAAGVLRPGRSQWGGVMAARVANALTVFLSLAALWISYLGNTFEYDVLPKLWLLLIAALAATAAACLGSWVMRVWVHGRFLAEPDSEDNVALTNTFPGNARPRARAGDVDDDRHSRRMRRQAFADAQGSVRFGPAVWVVSDMSETRPWPLPSRFAIERLSAPAVKAAVNLGILTIDVLPVGIRDRYFKTQHERVPVGTAAGLLTGVIAAYEADRREHEERLRKGRPAIVGEKPTSAAK